MRGPGVMVREGARVAAIRESPVESRAIGRGAVERAEDPTGVRRGRGGVGVEFKGGFGGVDEDVAVVVGGGSSWRTGFSLAGVGGDFEDAAEEEGVCRGGRGGSEGANFVGTGEVEFSDRSGGGSSCLTGFRGSCGEVTEMMLAA